MTQLVNLDRDMFWFPRNIVETDWGPNNDYNAPMWNVNTSGVTFVRHGYALARADTAAGDGFSCMGVSLRGAIEENTAFRFLGTATSSTTWWGCILTNDTGELKAGFPRLNYRGSLVDSIVCLEKDTVSPMDQAVFFAAVPSGSTEAIASLQVQRLASKPNTYLSAVS